MSPVAALAPITLAELLAEASLQTRVDRKYIVDPALWSRVVEEDLADARVLEIGGERRFAYESVYFDTPDRALYLAAERRRPRRFKVRNRTYLDTGQSMFEVKVRDGRGHTVKHRVERDVDSPLSLPAGADGLIVAATGGRGSAEGLEPVLRTAYERETLLTGRARVTVDHGTRAELIGPARAENGRWRLGRALIVETKSMSGASDTDRALWQHGVRPSIVSKYGVGLAALEPALPAHKWTRTLRRHAAALPNLAGAGALTMPAVA